MLPLSIACLSGIMSAASSLNIASQDSIAVSSHAPTSPSNSLDMLFPSSQSLSWPNISFPAARPPSLAANISALKALGLDTNEPIYWGTTPSGNVVGVQCHIRYGRRLDYQDCRDAYRYIPRSDEKIARFADRGSEWPYDIGLPLRIMGSMPSCRARSLIRSLLARVDINVADGLR